MLVALRFPTTMLTLLAALAFTTACKNEVASFPTHTDQGSHSSSQGHSFAGHEVGNGGDNYYKQIGAWFGDPSQEVKYCVHSVEGFSQNKDQLLQIIDKAIDTWIKYHNSNPISGSMHQSISKNWTSLAECNGSENVRFFFGADSELIRKRKKSYSKPLSLSFLTKSDQNDKDDQGTVWITKPGSYPIKTDEKFPNWNQEFRLQAYLIHVMGHIWGVPHVDGTIMREEVHTLISKPESVKLRKMLASIDHQKQVITNIDPSDKLPLKFHSGVSQPNSTEKLFGTRLPSSIELAVAKGLYDQGALIVRSDGVENHYPIDNFKHTTLKTDQVVFVGHKLPNRKTHGITPINWQFAHLITGNLKRTGQRFILEINGEGASFKLFLLESYQSIEVFRN